MFGLLTANNSNLSPQGLFWLPDNSSNDMIYYISGLVTEEDKMCESVSFRDVGTYSQVSSFQLLPLLMLS